MKSLIEDVFLFLSILLCAVASIIPTLFHFARIELTGAVGEQLVFVGFIPTLLTASRSMNTSGIKISVAPVSAMALLFDGFEYNGIEASMSDALVESIAIASVKWFGDSDEP